MGESEDWLEPTGLWNLHSLSLMETLSPRRPAEELVLHAQLPRPQRSEAGAAGAQWEPQELPARGCSTLTGQVSQQVTGRHCRVSAVLPWPSECPGCHFAPAFQVQCKFLLAESPCWEEGSGGQFQLNSGDTEQTSPGGKRALPCGCRTGFSAFLWFPVPPHSAPIPPHQPWPFTLSQVSVEDSLCSRDYIRFKG